MESLGRRELARPANPDCEDSRGRLVSMMPLNKTSILHVAGAFQPAWARRFYRGRLGPAPCSIMTGRRAGVFRPKRPLARSGLARPAARPLGVSTFATA